MSNNKNNNPSVASNYAKTYTTFSGHDMVCTFEIPINGKIISAIVGSLQTISYSVHDEKTPVRGLGDMNVKGYVYGPRTIAGSLIFTVFNRHWAYDIMNQYSNDNQLNAHFLVDELPPINITISIANEYGNGARIALYGVTFVNEGQVMSINDLYTENTFQYFATDIDYLTDTKRSTYKQHNANSNLPDKPTQEKPTSGNKDNQIVYPDINSNNEQNYNVVLYEDIRNEITQYIQFTSKIPPSKANELLTRLKSEQNASLKKVNDLFNQNKISKNKKTELINKINNDYRMLVNTINNNIGTEE